MIGKVLRLPPALVLLALLAVAAMVLAVMPIGVVAQVQVQRPAVQMSVMDDVRMRFTCRAGRVPLVQPAPDGSVDLECKSVTATPVVTPIVAPLLVPIPTGN